MSTNLKLTLAAAGLALLSVGGVTAAVTPSGLIAPVLDACPIDDEAGCADAVAAFVASRPADAARDDELADLVVALAYAAEHPNVTPAMCIELEQGIRTAGAAMTLPAPQQATKTIADNLCDNIELTFAGNASADAGSSSGGSSGGSSTSTSSTSTSSTSSSGAPSSSSTSGSSSTSSSTSSSSGGSEPTD